MLIKISMRIMRFVAIWQHFSEPEEAEPGCVGPCPLPPVQTMASQVEEIGPIRPPHAPAVSSESRPAAAQDQPSYNSP